MKKRVLAALLAAVTCATFATSCGSNTAEETTSAAEGTNESGEEVLAEDQTLNLNFGSDPSDWDPCNDVTTTSTNMYINMYATLYRNGEDGAVPGAAESYDVNDDGTVYTFHLREGMTFADGETPMTAYDFEYTWKRAIDPNTADDYAWFLCDFIKGGYDLNGLVPEDFDSDEAYQAAIQEAKDNLGVKALDETTLEVTLESSTPFFIDVVTNAPYAALSQTFIESLPEGATYGSSADTTLCGGPFTIESWNDDVDLTLVKNENYYDAENVTLDTINISFISESSTELMMYESGELDITFMAMTTADAANYAETSPDEYHTWELLNTGWATFNCEREPFNDPLVREALCAAIDYEVINENVIGGGSKAATGFIPAAMPNPADPSKTWREGETLQETTADTEKAISLLEEAGWVRGEDGTWTKDGEAFPTVKLNYNMELEIDGNVANAILGYWAAIGIPAELEPMERASRNEVREQGDFDVCFQGWGADYADASTFLNCMTSDHYYNYGKWFNDEFDALMDTAMSSTDQAERYEAMCAAEDLLFEENPNIMYQFATRPYLEKTYVKGVIRPALGSMDLSNAYVLEH